MAQPYPSFTPTYHHDQYPAIDPTRPELDCSNKVALITGAGGGIGQAIAVAFAKANALGVALLGRTRLSLEESARKVELASHGKTNAFVTTADITETSQVQESMRSIVKHFGRVPDVLINNAGGLAGVGSLIDVDVDEFMNAFSINVRGPLLVSQTFIRASREHSPDLPGTIINIPSGAAHVPFTPRAASYSASKLANAKVTEYLHHELPTWKIFNMQPGVVATELARSAGCEAPDTPELPAGFAVWLSAHPDAEALNGRFIWANWDIGEVLARKEEIRANGLLTLTLKGWAENLSEEELAQRAIGSRRNEQTTIEHTRSAD